MIEGFEQITKLFHMGERTDFDLTRPVPIINDASQLGNLDILRAFEHIVQEIVSTDDGEVALLGRKVLDVVLLPLLSPMRQSNPGVYDKYQKLLALLKFVNLVIYGIRDIDKIIKENLVGALQAGIRVEAKFQRVLDDFSDVWLEGSIAEALAKAMTTCDQKLGSSAIFLKDEKKSVPQTVGNWLNDYIQSSLTGGEKSTGSIERVMYIRQNQNIKNLSDAERNILQEILRIYDWLRYGGEVKDGEETESINGLAYLQSQKFKLPEGEPPQAEFVAKIANPPAIPTPGNAPAVKKVQMSEILGEAKGGKNGQDNLEGANRPGVNLADVLPDYKNSPRPPLLERGGVLPPATITAETLAAKMAADRNKQTPTTPSASNFAKATSDKSRPPLLDPTSREATSDLRKEGSSAVAPPATTINYIQQKSEGSSYAKASEDLRESKAEKYLQQQIDSKLADLKNKTEK